MRVLAWWRKVWADPYDGRWYITVSVSIPTPTSEFPVACVLVSFRSSNSRVLCRFTDIVTARKAVVIDEKAIPRLQRAWEEAEKQAQGIQHKLRVMMAASQPNSVVVDKSTGEIIAEAERIISQTDKEEGKK